MANNPAMPTDYHCESCNLVVQIGWYHFHKTDGCHWAATLGFCKRCGTIYRLIHGKPDSGHSDLADRQPCPLSIAESKMKGLSYSVPLEDWIPVGATGLCGHCGAFNELFFKEDPIPTCPRCASSRMKKLNSWLT